MQLLSSELVSLDYRDQLQQDLSRATVCRFLVAYVSLAGLDAIGRHLLTRALRDDRSFGIASLSCSCGYEPLIKLQNGLSPSPGVRLKYFMDPIVRDADDAGHLALFHSKLVYLLMRGEQKAVIYVGSHNWTQRALGPGSPRNVEASLRLECDVAPGDLDGTGSSFAAQVNRHLLSAWSLPACLPATSANEPTFIEWYERGCRRADLGRLDEAVIVLAVRKGTGATPSSAEWLNLKGKGIYLQALEEGDGQLVWNSNDRVLILVWDSNSDLQSARQPILLKCRITTHKAGLNSQLRGTNQSAAPVAGFEAVVFDETELQALRSGARAMRSPVRIWSGREVHAFDFEFPTQRSDSGQVDAGVEPKYQFHLEVEHVILPAEGFGGKGPELTWERESFAVAEKRDSARMEEKPGFFVDPPTREAILKCLREVLLINLDAARVLPFSETDLPKVGKRVSQHSLHETYIGEKEREHRRELYHKAAAGALVAELDPPVQPGQEDRRSRAALDAIPRAQRVFTMPFKELLERWTRT
jgi:hypothetical protein